MRLLVIDAIGMVLAGLGLAGLFTEPSGSLAFMADKHLAGLTAGVGFALVTFALGNIFRWHNRMRTRQRAQAQQRSGT
jgi:predicted Kef-type K+ transport protein